MRGQYELKANYGDKHWIAEGEIHSISGLAQP